MPKFVPPTADELARRGIGVQAPATPQAEETPKRRARKPSGRYKADDPKTTENEAWEEIKE